MTAMSRQAYNIAIQVFGVKDDEIRTSESDYGHWMMAYCIKITILCTLIKFYGGCKSTLATYFAS